MGRPPTPTAIKIARGTYRPDRARGNEPKAAGRPTCPSWMSNDAKKEFRRVVKLLSDMGLVGAADANLIARYATTWVRWRQAIQLLTQSGEVVVYRDADGKAKAVQPSAFHAIVRSLSEELSRAEMQLGMNPA